MSGNSGDIEIGFTDEKYHEGINLKTKLCVIFLH